MDAAIPRSPLLACQGATQGGRSPLGPITGAIEPGERLLIVGAQAPEILRWWVRLSEPTAGDVLVQGQRVQTLDPVALRRRVAWVAPRSTLLAPTVAATLAYPLALLGQDSQAIEAAIQETCDRFGIPASWLTRPAFQLTAAEQHWVAIARASLLQPLVLLLGDGFEGLTKEQSDRLQNLLQNQAFSSQTAAVVYTATTIAGLRAAPIATRCWVLTQGQLTTDRPASEMDWAALEKQFLSVNQAGLNSGMNSGIDSDPEADWF